MVTKASCNPAMLVESAPLVVGKFVEPVTPVTYAFPEESTATPCGPSNWPLRELGPEPQVSKKLQPLQAWTGGGCVVVRVPLTTASNMSVRTMMVRRLR